MRKGEALALEWSDIDFENKIIHITKGVSLDENDVPIISTPKTKKSVRTVSIDNETVLTSKNGSLNKLKSL